MRLTPFAAQQIGGFDLVLRRRAAGPTMTPVRSFDTCFGVRPESAIACFIGEVG